MTSPMLTILGSHGLTQIDSQWPNLCLVDRGNLTPDATVGVNMIRVDTTRLSPTSVLAFSGPGAVCPIEVLPGSRYFNVSKSQGACTWWLFDNLSQTSTGAGLRFFNPQGQIIYDAAWPPMRVLGNATALSSQTFFQYPPTNNQAPPSYSQVLGTFAGRDIAISHCTRAKGETALDNPESSQGANSTCYAQLGYSSSQGGQAQVTGRTFSTYQVGNRQGIFTQGFYLLLDVTGL